MTQQDRQATQEMLESVKAFFRHNNLEFEHDENGFYLDFNMGDGGAEYPYTLYLHVSRDMLCWRAFLQRKVADLPFDLYQLAEHFRGEEQLFYGTLGAAEGAVNYWLNQIIPADAGPVAEQILVKSYNCACQDISRFVLALHLELQDQERQQMSLPLPCFNVNPAS